MEITATTMMDAWKRAVHAIASHGHVSLDDEKRECRELLNLAVTVEQPATIGEAIRAMRSTRKWIYPSEDELANIMLNKESSPIYDYLYGQRIFAYEGVLNQVDEHVIPSLQARPGSRRAFVSLLNPVEDLRSGASNTPGIILISFRIIEKKLCVTALIRTSGFFTGWPANVYQVARLQEYVARALSIVPGSVTTISLSAHLYADQYDDIAMVLGKDVLERK